MLDVIILAGGKGERLGMELPKALVSIKGKPIISHQIDYLLNKVNKIILSIGYKSDDIIKFIQSNYKSDKIVFSVEDEPLGTGGAIKASLAKADTEFVLVLNCDDITDIDISELEKIKENTLCVANPRLPFGLVSEKDGYASFIEKPKLNDLWVNCGWYVFNRDEILKALPDKGSLEYEVFPKIKLRVYKHEGFWITFNTKKDITEYEKEVNK